jgi:hypothetical protein
MFKITGKRTFTHSVKVMTPIDGGFEEESLKVTYNLLDVDTAGAFDLKTRQGTTDFLLAAVVKLDDLQNGQGSAVPYSDAVRDQLFGLPHVRNAVAMGYFDAFSKAGAGN